MSIKKRAKIVERFNNPLVTAQPSPHTTNEVTSELKVDREAIRGICFKVAFDFFFFSGGCGRVRLIGDG